MSVAASVSEETRLRADELVELLARAERLGVDPALLARGKERDASETLPRHFLGKERDASEMLPRCFRESSETRDLPSPATHRRHACDTVPQEHARRLGASRSLQRGESGEPRRGEGTAYRGAPVEAASSCAGDRPRSPGVAL